MNQMSDEAISRYVLDAFGRTTEQARVPRRKIDEIPSVATARIVLSVQFAGRYSFIPMKPVDIRADSAEWYGYEDGIPRDKAPSMLDVLVQAHELIYGDDFSRKTCRALLDVGENGILHRMMGVPGLFTCFVINGQYAYDSDSDYGKIGYRGLGFAETPIYDLDVVEIFGFDDSVGLDYYTYFMRPDGSWIRSARVAPGEPLTVRHEGYMFVFGGPYVHEDRIERRMVAPVAHSQLAVVNTKTFDLVDISGAITDDEGFVTFELDTPGDYYITAHDGIPARRRASLSLPWLPVIVEEKSA